VRRALGLSRKKRSSPLTLKRRTLAWWASSRTPLSRRLLRRKVA